MGVRKAPIALAIAGAVAIVAGLALIHPAAGLLATGALLLAAGALPDWGDPGRDR